MEHVVLPGAGGDALSFKERGEKGIGPDRRFCAIVTCHGGTISNGCPARLAEHPERHIQRARQRAQRFDSRIRVVP
jgi:hypothetical protein